MQRLARAKAGRALVWIYADEHGGTPPRRGLYIPMLQKPTSHLGIHLQFCNDYDMINGCKAPVFHVGRWLRGNTGYGRERQRQKETKVLKRRVAMILVLCMTAMLLAQPAFAGTDDLSEADMARMFPQEYSVAAEADSTDPVQSDGIVQPGLQTIGRHAFDNCPDLQFVTLPESVTSFGENSFSDAVILCATDSYAETYAVASGIQYVLSQAS